MKPEIQAGFDAASAILRDCRHGGTCEIRMGKGEILRCCAECWNQHVRARRAARKAQLAAHAASLPACEGEHSARVPARWNLAGVQLCGRCATRAKRKVERDVYASGMAGLAMLGAFRPGRFEVLNALKGGG